jgi:hypothetical protein
MTLKMRLQAELRTMAKKIPFTVRSRTLREGHCKSYPGTNGLLRHAKHLPMDAPARDRR